MILWQSDFMIPTGFGQQAEYIIEALNKAGHQINVIAWQHRGKPIEIEGVRVFPSQHAQWGRDQYSEKLWRIKPDLVITLSDLWQVAYMCGIPREAIWIAIGAVDTTPLPRGFTDTCYDIDHFITYSQFGKEVIDKKKIRNTYIPHGVDLDLFKAATEEQKKQYKRLINIDPDAFVIGFCGRINPRKQLGRTLRIFELLSYDYDNLLLFLHSDLDDPMGREQRDLRDLCDLLNISDKVKASKINWNEGIPLDQMRFIYGAMDLYLTTTAGEGFGVPLIEAQACGVPCIATNYTTPPELIKGHGELIDVERFVNEDGVRRARCSIEDGVKKVAKLIDNEKLRTKYSKKSIEFVKKNYDIKMIVQKWLDFLETFDIDLQDADIEELFKETTAVQKLKQQILARQNVRRS